jgi:hypothetical protein
VHLDADLVAHTTNLAVFALEEWSAVERAGDESITIVGDHRFYKTKNDEKKPSQKMRTTKHRFLPSPRSTVSVRSSCSDSLESE